MKNKLIIFCVTDKKIDYLKNLPVKLAGVGKSKFPKNYITCLDGNNIQHKELNYSELTFHYWFWKNYLKKLLVKINRLAGYEIIDQSNYFVETLDKKADKNLSSLGNNSITLPLGKLEIKRKVKSLDIIIRSCASVKMLSQSKERIFAKEKFEYSIRTLNSIVNSINYCKDIFNNINLKITILDHNSSHEVKKKYENILNNSSINFEIVDLNFENYKKYINNIN